ncbi:MAG: leucine-rich repeat protein [Bacteroidaceae bacterium]|nr:leucine-rich repeat protein [Bacteroidaceae bacterium]
MKKLIFIALTTIITVLGVSAQTVQGTCGTDVLWTFDGKTLTVSTSPKAAGYVPMKDYDLNEVAPWTKRGLPVKSVVIGYGISRIGSCAFADCKELTEVVFESTTIREIGWGAFINCSRLRTISLPSQLSKIETIAFANCPSITSVKIPDQCRVEDQAFINCPGIHGIEISPTASIGQYVFAREVKVNGKTQHALYNGEIIRLPAYINVGNSRTFGIARAAIERYNSQSNNAVDNADYDYATSEVDSIIPYATETRNDTYALIIGNQNYRFVPSVPYAIHDARIFRSYCEKALGIPAEHIHISEDATKEMIIGEEMEWLKTIRNRDACKLIVYYAGHGVPDINGPKAKSYILPTDIRGTMPQKGISLDDFYAQLGNLAFAQTTVFLDACFSGITRDSKGLNEGLRAVEIPVEEGTLSTGNIVVFSAAQSNETAQGFMEEGHGLFTYYLLKEIQENYARLNLGHMSDNIKQNVSRKAVQLRLRKPQTPNTSASEALANAWRLLPL